MFHQWNGQSPKSNLSAISILIFHHTAVFLLVIHCCGGQSQVVGPTKPILAIVGDDIILPCHLEPAKDVVAETLEWARFDLRPRFVHVRRDGLELLVNQNPSYIGRTSVSTDKLKHGDMSLKLSKVKPSDEGEYRCHIPGLGTSVVELAVGAVSSPFIVSIDRTSSGVILQCESAGWYPEPEVFWLDGEGKLVSAGPTETVRGPDDLYTVSSRVTVEKRHSNSFTCRVQQQNINQARETEIRILEDVFMAPSSSAVRIIVVLSVCFLLFSAFFLVFWKLSQNKGPNKMHHDNETEDGTGEREQFVRGSTKRKDLDEEKLQEKEKEQNDMIHVISVLMEQKKELENSRDKHMSQLEKVGEGSKKKEKKPESVKSKVKWKKGDKKNKSLEGKQDQGNRKTEDENIKEKLQKTQEVITTITEWKQKGENQIEQIKKLLDETKRQRHEIQSEQLERQEETNINTDSSTSGRVNNRLSTVH
ncbi:butyrophilin subfamily 3 member A2-like isoform X2 [Siniperca chuatsi]|uniref:butyrophilin subfamily 3 member A2-like isoform X2 n=1 Tax=Siniperca chuatsi TaxID=119488 RepID=UPI001CE11955|nr:butyrophilin subfamily 3 member A2-like isoform X2 [Siniperca chuatsi]